MTQALDPRYVPLVLDVLDLGVFTVDERTHITSFNRAAELITGFEASQAIGLRCADVFRTNLCATVCPLRQSIASGEPLRNREVSITRRDGRVVPISVSTAPLLTPEGELLGGVEVFRDLTQMVDLRRKLSGRFTVEDVIGKSPPMQRVLDLLPVVAESDSTILITGASGTGKELVARTIHQLGPRGKAPFVAFNAAAIPETLLESELFGYKRGAFTGARKDKPGRIASAEGGTLLLDEIGDLPPNVQVKVLRFLENRVYEPLGANSSETADLRVIAATNQNLEELVRKGEFRQDLFFRLNVLEIELPPLADRPEDLPLLVEHFVRAHRATTGKPIVSLSPKALEKLVAYPFPGNVRELENIVERGFILCQGEQIEEEHLPPAVRTGKGRGMAAPTASLEAGEAQSIRLALERNEGNRTHTARELGIHRTTLLRKIKRLGI